MKHLKIILAIFLILILVGCSQSNTIDYKKDMTLTGDKIISREYKCDIDDNGKEETIIQLEDTSEEYGTLFEYLVYSDKNDLLYQFTIQPNGEDGKLYYSKKYNAIAVKQRGSDFNLTYFYDVNGKCVHCIGYMDDKETDVYTRRYYDITDYCEDINDYAKYEFTNYKWGDPEGEEKAVKLYEDKLGPLTALEEQ